MSVPPTPLCRFLYSDRTRVSQPCCVSWCISHGRIIHAGLCQLQVSVVSSVTCGLPQSQVGTSCFHKTCHGSLCTLGPIPRVYEGSGFRSQGVLDFVDQLAGRLSPFPFGYVECAAYGGALKYLRTNYIFCVRCLVNFALPSCSILNDSHTRIRSPCTNSPSIEGPPVSRIMLKTSHCSGKF